MAGATRRVGAGVPAGPRCYIIGAREEHPPTGVLSAVGHGHQDGAAPKRLRRLAECHSLRLNPIGQQVLKMRP
jgi:hypothetical protein